MPEPGNAAQTPTARAESITVVRQVATSCLVGWLMYLGIVVLGLEVLLP